MKIISSSELLQNIDENYTARLITGWDFLQ